MVTLEKTAVPLHQLKDNEVQKMRDVWGFEWLECHRANDLDGIEQAEMFANIYDNEWMRRDPLPR